MQSVRQIERLNQTELDKCIPPNASWHTDYRDTAYIHIGGLPFELSEGDILTIFSQYGNPVHLNLVRDKETGKSRGFAFLKYEDQRSCDLAVDNMSGAGVMGRVLGVDHCRYKLKEGEIEGEGLVEEAVVEDETDREDEGGRRKRRRRESESESEEERPLLREESELAKLLREHDDDDPMKAYMIKEKKAEVEEALKALTVSKKSRKDRHADNDLERRHRHHRSKRDHSRDRDETRRDGHRSRREEDEDRRKDRYRSRKDVSDDEDDLAKDRKRRSERRSRSRDIHSKDGHARSRSPHDRKDRHWDRRDKKRDRSPGDRHRRAEDSEDEYRRKRDERRAREAT